MASSFAFRDRSRSLLCRLILLRPMGGGPRTFPGGLSKWQYKRMHEKLAREKEHKLLHQEKQLYQARLRTEIRAKALSGVQTPPSSADAGDPGPMSSKDHIKALADRFMKAGAEDLWNEDDGPVRSPARRPPPPLPPIDLRKLASDRRGMTEDRNGSSFSSFDQRRGYSVIARRGPIPKPQPRWRRNSSSDEDSGSESASGFSLEGNLLKKFQGGDVERKKDSRFPRLSFAKEQESEEEFGGGSGRRETKKMMSGAALKNHDVRATVKRVHWPREVKGSFSEQMKEFREMKNMEARGDDVRRQEVEKQSVLTQKRFDECDISPLTTKALSDAGYIQMTVVQEAVLPVCIEGKDAIVKARTGTGKSAAFLLPAIEAVLKVQSSKQNLRVPPILVLILCPTRELAIQLAAEANVLLKYHDGIGVQTLIGGTRFKLDQKRMDVNPSQIIVATPGRLLDHIENKSGFTMRLMGLNMLILDEADHLLDLGFRKDIEKIVDCVPRQRQSLLFSATIPKEVRRISQLVLKKEHIFVDTVGFGGFETHPKVLQSYLIAPHELHFHIVHHFLKEHVIQEPDYKVIVFCTTAMVTAFMFVLLRNLKMNVREMHSRKPQLYRTRISDEFRESKQMILVTSDVSARGMNYPDVTLVIQVGIPPDREQYIHRLGRTGREGKDGRGILILAPWEDYFMDGIKDLPIEKSQLPELDLDIKQKVEDSILKVDTSIKEAAYHAWLGYYNSLSDIGRDKTMLAELANRFSLSIGLERPPALFRKTALKMGLKDIPGIRIRK